jgi:zinc protease
MRTRSRFGRAQGCLVAASACLVLLALSVAARASRPAPAAEIWRETPVKVRLSTGIECLFQRDTTSPTTVVHVFSRGGKSAVAEGKDGLAYLAARLALEIPDSDKARDLMTQAVLMRFSVDEERAVISIACLSETLEDTLGILALMIQSPLASAVRIDHGKKTMALLGPAREDDAVETGHDAALRAFFGPRGPGGALYGNAQTLKAIGKKDISGYYDAFFTRQGLFFSVCSDLELGTITSLLEKSFDGFPEGPATEPAAVLPAVPADRDVHLEKETRQAYVARACLLPPVTPETYGKAYLLEVLLGQGPGSKLWPLRSRDHLAYNVSARVTWTRGAGLLEAFLETDKTKTAKAQAALGVLLSDLGTQGISADELAMTKTMARTWFLRANEAKDARAGTMGSFESLGLGVGYLTGILAALEAVSLEDMNAFIRTVLDPDRAVGILIGPAGVSETPRPRS